MYVWLKEEKIVFLYRILEIHFSKGKLMYTRTDWETTYLGHHVELGWRLKVFSSFVFEFFLGTGTTLAIHSTWCTGLMNPTLNCLVTSSLIFRSHSVLIRLNFCLMGTMWAWVPMWGWAILGSIPGISSLDHANTSWNFVSNSFRSLLSFHLKLSQF